MGLTFQRHQPFHQDFHNKYDSDESELFDDVHDRLLSE